MDCYIGAVVLFAGDYAPKGFALCQGQEMNISQDQVLYAVIGNRYGGDLKKNTFNLPSLEAPEDRVTKFRLAYIICIKGEFPQRT